MDGRHRSPGPRTKDLWADNAVIYYVIDSVEKFFFFYQDKNVINDSVIGPLCFKKDKCTVLLSSTCHCGRLGAGPPSRSRSRSVLR